MTVEREREREIWWRETEWGCMECGLVPTF